jgi:hypothetical protein
VLEPFSLDSKLGVSLPWDVAAAGAVSRVASVLAVTEVVVPARLAEDVGHGVISFP